MSYNARTYKRYPTPQCQRHGMSQPGTQVPGQRTTNHLKDAAAMSSHCGILIHVVFSTKYRKPVLAIDWRDELYAYIGGIVKDHKASLVKAGGIEDHVHLLIRTHPEFAISKTIQLLKANSSKWINEQSKTRSHFQWQRGYGAFSVSQMVAPAVIKYIEGQIEHHKKFSFQDEFLLMLERHRIDFDPKYVFEREIVE